MFNHILLCTHGSNGAQKAENFVFGQLLAEHPELKVTVLTIIDQDWATMSQDDWLNTSKARTLFKDYVEEQLTEEIEQDWDRIKKDFPHSENCTFTKIIGEIEKGMVEMAAAVKADAIVIGPTQIKKSRLFSVKMEKGLAHTIDNKKLQPALSCPLIIAPENL